MLDAPHGHTRMVPRVPGDTVGPLGLTASDGNSFYADVKDISILGIGLISVEKYPAGASFVVATGPNGQALADVLTVEICHATELSDGRWLLGCKFSRHLTIDDMEVMGSLRS
jgi:hypothetical protein